MKETFEDIIKKSLENYSPAAPEHLLKKLQTSYPKPGFRDFVSLHSIQISVILGILISGIIALVIFTNNTKNNSPQTADSNNSSNNETINTNIRERDNSMKPSPVAVWPKKSNSVNTFVPSDKNKTVDTRIFTCSDTSVCGNEITISTVVSVDKLFIDHSCKIEETNANLFRITASIPGVYYLKHLNSGHSTDSMRICFTGTAEPRIKIVENVVCAGEPLVVMVDNANSRELFWDIENATVESAGNNLYKIVFKSYEGQKVKISVSARNAGCSCNTCIEYQLPEKLQVKTSVEPEICSNSNGVIHIKTNATGAHYLLNNTKENSDGTFRNLKHGNYNVSVIYNNGCFENFNITIPANKQLKASFTYNTDPANSSRLLVTNTTSIDNKGYTQFGDIDFTWIANNETYYSDNPTLEFSSSGKQEVILVASYGESCKDTCRTAIQISNDEVLIPNIFSPNGDGISDIFFVKASNVVSFRGIITNIRGEVVFNWDNISEGWDGKINGNNLASEGVYYYLIGIEFTNGNKVEKKGSLNLIRK